MTTIPSLFPLPSSWGHLTGKITDVAVAFVFPLDDDCPKILDRVVWADVDTFDAFTDADNSTSGVGMA